MKTLLPVLVLGISAFPIAAAHAGPGDFSLGPTIESFGPVAPHQEAWSLLETTSFKVAFDSAKAAEPGKLNRTLESAARFINMHTQAGVPKDNIELAVIVHGSAYVDVVKNEVYQVGNDGAENASALLIAELLKHNVRIILCGQTAAYRDVTRDDLIDGLELSISAMTAHALLQQQGYTVNPF
jgi:intracellular sulfur oxidation DsrE/DsrF family protein